MSSKLVSANSIFIPPPTGGLNLISAPLDYEPNEARQLNNYAVYKWGIRELPSPQALRVINGKTIVGAHGYLSPSSPYTGPIANMILIYSDNTIDNLNLSTNTLTGVTPPGVSIGGDPQTPCVFNGNVFIGTKYNGNGIIYNIAAGTATFLQTSFTGTAGSAYVPFSYKQRLYMVRWGTTQIYYGDVSAVSGATKSFDFGPLVSDGSQILFACSWSYNQGLSNDELFLVVTDTGEIIVYQGDFPAANNWQLVAKSRIPTPMGPAGYRKLGQDIQIQTQRGIVSIQKFFAGSQSVGDNYYILSYKLGPVLTNGNTYPMLSSQDPLTWYWSSDNQTIYLLNYEIGAWSTYRPWDAVPFSSITNVFGSIADPTSSKIYIATDSDVFTLDPTNGSASFNVVYTWQTPYYTFSNSNGVPLQKTLKMARPISRNFYGPGVTISGSVAAMSDFNDASIGAFSSYTTGSPYNNPSPYYIFEVSPTAIGRYISYQFTKSNSISSINELAGFEAFFDAQGGA